uniref:Adaptor related protein complex 3 subunit sigma 1 n=1 Tax=Ursus maritimus TaxID=29073 RepID=A0A452VGX0_URSMA
LSPLQLRCSSLYFFVANSSFSLALSPHVTLNPAEVAAPSAQCHPVFILCVAPSTLIIFSYLFTVPYSPSVPDSWLIGGSDNKLIYRHYATLYFVFCVDSSESELGILDLIQVFVETLDKCFENVCELDLIFHVDKVHNILAEMVMGGMVLETNMNEIVTQIDAQNKLEKSEAGLAGAPARAVSAVKNMNLPEIPRNINIGDISIKVPNLPSFK